VEPYEVVFAVVILGRFLVPLSIPRYPLPGILGSLLLDASDRAIYVQFVEIDVEAYQTYDKALDIYYQMLAYVATLRNWSNEAALRIGRYLWYYRLVGVALFEVSGARWLLLVFPNVFEYFFIFYETVRLRWDPSRLRRGHLVGAALGIWAVVKIPQEYWVHVAQRDTTDFIKVHVVGAPLELPWVHVLAANPWIFGVVAALLLLGWAGAALGLRLLPAPDRVPRFHADALVEEPRTRVLTGRPRLTDPFERRVLVERVVLVSLVAIIFGEMLPGWEATPFQVVAAVTVLIVANATVSVWLGRRGLRWRGAVAEFATIGTINVALVLGYRLVTHRLDVAFDAGNALFFVALLSLIVTLHDRYLALRRLRPEEPRGPAWAVEEGPPPASGGGEGRPPPMPGRDRSTPPVSR
jgi:hypothetical protein